MTLRAPLLHDATASLAPFVDAGVLDASAVHVADAIARSTGGLEPDVLLAAALAARAPRFGHICVVLDEVAGAIVVDNAQLREVETLPWPDPVGWAARLVASLAVRASDDASGDVILPLVWDGTRLYLERYWRFEQRVADDLLRRAATTGRLLGASTALDVILDGVFAPTDPPTLDLQRVAVEHALTHRLTVVAGGPGTGKTRTIARLLVAAQRAAIAEDRMFEIALAAPTGKAASRMTEAVHAEIESEELTGVLAETLEQVAATTLHRLLGARGNGRFTRNRSDPLPHDMVIVDETSMVSLPLMARLLDALRPDATLVLVGDPFQLASVEAGAVLGEIVGPAGAQTVARRGAQPPVHAAEGPIAADVVLLQRVHRFRADSAIAALADAIRTGDADTALTLLREHPSAELTWVDGDDTEAVELLHQETATAATEVIRAAREGDAEDALRRSGAFKVLCATRFGPLGVYRWTDEIETRTRRAMPDLGIGRGWYVGRPVIVTANDYLNQLFNGDTGIVVEHDGRSVVAFPGAGGSRELAIPQLGDVDTWWAMTIHKSQGSEFRRVIVTLPPPPSPILTRELLYTAVTRAKEEIAVVATEEALRAAIGRPVTRASGLREKLWS